MGLTIEASHIFKAYNGHEVLKDCSFVFDRGGAYALLGPNGSGKSTLFRILSLLERPDRGQVRYLENGRFISADLNLRRRITLVLPRLGVFNTTVFRNAAYGLKLRGLAKGEIEARVNEVLDMVGLTKKRWQPALGLSSGETQRLGLARALAINPEVIFLDEPTASIDPVNIEIIEEIILTVKSRREATIIMITHDPGQAQRLGDHLLVMKNGKIMARGV
ncbi:MAG: ATP-binding cassette domain-containing protein [Desulfobaccales bacterium]|nr:ATP-binding cassette domain-containing protein [Desulfobaccales bacterium]